MDFGNLSSPMISGSDVYLDGSLPFPEISNTGTTGISPDVHTAGTSSSSLTQTLSGSDGHSGNGIIPTLSTVTHTFSRPINTSGSQSSLPGTVGVSTTGSRPPASYYGYVFPSSGAPPLPAWSHPSWPQPNPGYPNQSFPGYWPSPMPFGDAGSLQVCLSVQELPLFPPLLLVIWEPLAPTIPPWIWSSNYLLTFKNP